MKVKAIYHQNTSEDDEGSIAHVVTHDNGSFQVSGKDAGVMVAGFLNFATPSDMRALHNHLLYAFHEEMKSVDDMVEKLTY